MITRGADQLVVQMLGRDDVSDAERALCEWLIQAELRIRNTEIMQAEGRIETFARIIKWGDGMSFRFPDNEHIAGV